MNARSRTTSILKANHLDDSITGFPTFNLSKLDLEGDLEFQLPTNLRLGHLAEKVVSELFKLSSNYNLIYENAQIIEDKKTLGEIDFIIEEKETKQLTHLELAYKFYLFDPSISSEPINNWIGPNRNDSLKEKLEKLKGKQFPILHHPSAKSKFNDIAIDEVSQALCFLVSLFIPYEFKEHLNTNYQEAIKGCYLGFETFTTLDTSEKTYYLPSKKEWGMNPSENNNWNNFEGVKDYITTCMKEKQSPLCWQKNQDSYSTFFIVWWW